MHAGFLQLLRCPVTRTPLQIEVISTSKKIFNGTEKEIIYEGILFAENDWFYPIINGIPRLIVEAFIDYKYFFLKHLPDYEARKNALTIKYCKLINFILNKNRRTKQSFTAEWSLFNYEKDKTWNADGKRLLQRFLDETLESRNALQGKLIFDAGCGNGLLNQYIAKCGATIVGLDFGLNIERAYSKNTEPTAFFVQGDVQFPPFPYQIFDIVHSSGVLHHTNNTELSFSCIEPYVKPGGKLSIWLYHSRKDPVHNLFNVTRRITSRWPVKLQYYIYSVTLLPVIFIIKKLKGKKQNRREMMIDILDWLSPEFRWEHDPKEVAGWFAKHNYINVNITTTDTFGFNITGIKNEFILQDENRDS